MTRKSTGSGIYCIKNLMNGKVYIGQALHIERRLYEHLHYLKLGTDKAIALQRAVNKYGLDNFEFSILEHCSADDLNEREIFYIHEFNSNNKKNGYNIASGGNSGLIGYKWPKWFGEKISKAKKGWVMGQEQREFISKLHTGKIVSDETRKKMSDARKGEKHHLFGKHHSDDTKKKMSESKLGEKSYQFGKKSKNASSQYFGVHRIISKGHVYWVSYIKVNSEKIYLGASKDEVESAKMYDAFVIERGLPNPLNFPNQ